MRSSLIAVALVAVLLGGCGARPAPAPVKTSAPAPVPAPASPGPSTPAQSAAGRYTIVGAQSRASYQAREKFVNRELPSEAVGSTAAITGDLLLGAGGLQPSTVSVDLRTLVSDEARRDRYIQGRTLETAKYPYAEFRLESSTPAALSFAEGQETKFQIRGTMKIHGVERPLTWDVAGTKKGSNLQWQATTQFKLSDFQIQPPDLVNMLKVEDGLKLSVSLVAQPAA